MPPPGPPGARRSIAPVPGHLSPPGPDGLGRLKGERVGAHTGWGAEGPLEPPTLPLPTAAVAPTMPVRLTDAGTPPIEHPTGNVTPAPPKRRRKAPLLVLVTAVVVAAILGAAALVNSASEQHRAPPGRLASGEAVFESLLATSANAHHLVESVLAASCAEDAPAAARRSALIDQVDRAIDLQGSVLDGLQANRPALTTMPDGPLLITELDAATDASLTVDRDYEAWLVDLQATGCYSAPTNDIHYRAAMRASPAETGADQRLAGVWAHVASHLSLRSWAADQL